MYKVIRFFTDLKDNGRPYNVGDIFPRKGLDVTQKRLDELASSNNRQCVPLIEEIPEVTDAIIYQKATKTSDSSITWGIVTEPISMDVDEVYQVSPDVGVINTGPASGLVTTPGKSDEP